MDARNKKLVLIGIRRKGESRFKIRTVTGQKSDCPGMVNGRKTGQIALAR